MGYRIVRPATREEWLAERKKGIGSSDAGTIMGASAFCTPYGLWAQKRGLAPPPAENDAMFNGHVLEPATADWFEKRTGYIVDRGSEGDWMAVDTDREYLRVSPDRICYEPGTPPERQVYANGIVLELKSTSRAVTEDDYPDYWFCQIQYQMGILGLERGFLCWITGSPTLRFGYAEVRFNRAFFDTLVGRIERFWLDNVIGGAPPPAETGGDAAMMFPVHADGRRAEASDEVWADYLELRAARAAIRELEAREAELADRLRLAAADAEAVVRTDRETGEERVLCTWRSAAREVFDEEGFRRDEPELWERYALAPALDRKRLEKEQREVYRRYASKVPGGRRFSLK